MKKNKGFTLIELLAVIVILAIIALIATPLILNIINRARKQAFQRSAEGVLKAGKNYYLLEQLEPQGFNKVTFHCENDKCLSEDNKELEVEGNVGIGDVTIDKKGNVALKLSNGSYCTYKYASKNSVEVKDGDCSDVEVGSKVLAKEGDTFTAIVYFDPTDLNKVCDAGNANGNTLETSGCMKWYVYEKADNVNYGLLLDHNLSWTSYEDTLEVLDDIKNEWKDTIGKDNIGMISGADVAMITGKTGWDRTNTNMRYYLDSKNQTDKASKSNPSQYYWLFDYTRGCKSYGCKIEDTNGEHYGYWTSDFICNDNNDISCDNVWHVHVSGQITYTNDLIKPFRGLRPVITISKSQIDL